MSDLGDFLGGLGELFGGIAEFGGERVAEGIADAAAGGEGRRDERATVDRYLTGGPRTLNVNDV